MSVKVIVPGMQPGTAQDQPSAREPGSAAAAIRAAFEALVTGARRLDIPPGSFDAPRLADGHRSAWIEGLRVALAELPVVVVTVGAQTLYFGELPVLDHLLAERAHAAGVRGIVLSAGASDDDLLWLARTLLTDWPETAALDGGLERAVWGAPSEFVHVELASRAASLESEHRGPGRLRSTVDAGPDEATGEEDFELLPPEARDYLHAVRAGPAAADAPRPPAAVDPELAAEARVLATEGDFVAEVVAAAAAAALSEAGEDRRARAVEALLGFVVDVLGQGASLSPVLHALLEVHGGVVTAEGLARPPLADRLVAVAPDLRENDVKGELFSMFAMLPERAAGELAPLLPPWVTRILADACLATRHEGASTFEDLRQRMQSAIAGEILLGLAMAARSDDPRLIEPVLLHVDHAAPHVRVAALYALRRQRSPRVRDLVRRHIEDVDEAVRMEALRYCVAYREADALPLIEARLTEPVVASWSDGELRAWCIAHARIGRQETFLVELATGRKRAGHPNLPRLALAGIRVVGPRARAALELVAQEAPRLRADITALLAEER